MEMQSFGLQPRIAGWLLRGLFLVAFVAILVWQWQAFQDSPERSSPSAIIVSLQQGETRTLGRTEMAAPAAEARHLRIRRDAAGGWRIANASESREVEVRCGGRDELLRSMVLQKDARFSIGRHLFHVSSLNGDQLHLRESDLHEWRYDGSALHSNASGDAQQAICRAETRPESAKQTLRQRWNVLAPSLLAIPTPLELGGMISCGNRIALPDVAPGLAVIARTDAGQFVLRASAGNARAVCLAPTTDGACPAGMSLHEQEVGLDDVSRLIVGRTAFGVRTEGGRLTLTPIGRVGLVEPAAPTPEGVEWRTSPLDPWRWPVPVSPWIAGCLWLLAVSIGAAMLQWSDVRVDAGQAMLIATSISGVLTGLLAYILGGRLGHGWSLLLESAALILLVCLPHRHLLSWLSFALAGLLLAIGLSTQLALGLVAADSGGLRFFQSGASLMLASVSMWFGLTCWLHGHRPLSSFGAIDMALIVLALSALILLLLQVMFGNEAGVFSIQPAELAKLTLILLAAHVLAIRLDFDRGRALTRLALWMRFLLPVLVFVTLVVLSLVLVHDFSPLVLLASWLVGVLLAWALASGRAAGFAGAVLLVVAAIALLGYIRWTAGDSLPEMGSISDRVDVWLQAELHPHRGEQFRRGLGLFVRGGESGATGMNPWRVPEIQNDFAPAWFLALGGAWGGVALVLLQATYLGCLLSLGWGWLRQAQPGDYRHQWLARWLHFSLWGGAFVLAGHFAVSWGTNLGWLPVMGQPMPFLSSAGSLLIFLLAPLQALLSIPRQVEGVGRPATDLRRHGS